MKSAAGEEALGFFFRFFFFIDSRHIAGDRQHLATGEACLLGSLGARWPHCQQAGAGSNQGCEAQLELPTSAARALGWLKATLCSVCT